MRLNLWVAKDKNGDCHISNVRPHLSDNGRYFTIDIGYSSEGIPSFHILTDNIPGLTFENSPKQLDIIPAW